MRTIASQKQHTDGLLQITRAYYTNAKGEEKVLTRNEYTITEPKEQAEAEDATCRTNAMFQGGGCNCRRGTRQTGRGGPSADPECEVHGKPNYRAEQEAAERERQKAWKRQQEQQLKNRENNRRLFDAVLDRFRKL